MNQTNQKDPLHPVSPFTFHVPKGRGRDAFELRFQTFRRDPLGRRWAEAFWNSRSQGLATLRLSQFQLSFPAQPGEFFAPPVTSASPKGIPTERRDLLRGKGYSAAVIRREHMS